MDFLMNLLVRGVGEDSVSESIEEDLLQQLVIDGLLAEQGKDGFKVDLATSRGKVATRIAQGYLLGQDARTDHTLAVQWHFLAGVYGSPQSSQFCARYVAATVMDAVARADKLRTEQGHVVGHPWLAEALAAVCWWVAWSGREAEALSEPVQEHRYFVAGTPRRLLAQAVEGMKTRGGWSDFLLGRKSAIAEPGTVAARRKEKLQGLKQDTEKQLKEAAQRNARVVADKCRTLEEGTKYDPYEGWDGDEEPKDPLAQVVTYDIRDLPKLRPAIDPIMTSKNGGVPEHYVVLNEELPLPVVDDIDSLEAALRVEFPYAETAINVLMRDLKIGKRWGRQAFLLRPTLLVGPPGTGKTRMIRRIGELSGVQTRIIPCAGSSDNRDWEGTSRGFSSANPSFPARFFWSEGTAGGIFGFDEIDKASTGSQNGSLRDSLINATERMNAFQDAYLQARLDLSGISFLATANDVTRLPMPLLSRFRIVEVPAPGLEHLRGLVRGIRADLASEYGIDMRLLPELDDVEMTAIEQHYRRSRSIRSLRRAVEVVMDFRDRHPVLN